MFEYDFKSKREKSMSFSILTNSSPQLNRFEIFFNNLFPLAPNVAFNVVELYSKDIFSGIVLIKVVGNISRVVLAIVLLSNV